MKRRKSTHTLWWKAPSGASVFVSALPFLSPLAQQKNYSNVVKKGSGGASVSVSILPFLSPLEEEEEEEEEAEEEASGLGFHQA